MDIKDRIIQQAGRLFFQYGVKSTSMDEVASSLGISKRTIYENFRDKEDLLLSYLKQVCEDRKKAVQELMERFDNVVEVFLHIMEIHKTATFANIKFYEDIYRYYPNVDAFLKEESHKANEFFVQFLKKGVEQGVIRENLNIEVVAFLVEESTSIYMRASHIDKFPFSFSELISTVMVNFIRGISTEKGIKIVDKYLEKQQIEQK
ncbi:MAG: TetR/AcrR family transcriptional regulator [Dysgonamonadaceae bacterium]|jgi:AcrR family transcriptional regulator|nr:TetR/AcrR family transcriptional regulator [Dysgonamonadaceae bacterium]